MNNGKLEPRTIGYWARMNNLNWEDFYGDEDLMAMIDMANHAQQFQYGWQDANEEIKEERIAKFKKTVAKLTAAHE